MKSIVKDTKLVAYCGLYCGGCGKYLNDMCPGCQKNEKAGWCKVRKCCIENGKMSCSDCNVYADPKECKKFNNIFSQLFSFIFGSDRAASIGMIKEKGYDAYAEKMAAEKSHCIKRKKK